MSLDLPFMTMNRTVLSIIIVAIAGVLLTSCRERNDDGLNREILIETVWEGENFHSATSVNHLLSDDDSTEFFYIFGKNGIMDIYPNSDTPNGGMPLASLRYIYTPQDNEIVIESFGLLLVKEISVDRLLLEGISGSLDLHFHSDINFVVSADN